MILSHRVYFGFGFEKITKTRRVFGFGLIHILFQLAKMIFTAKTIDITLCNIANQLKTQFLCEIDRFGLKNYLKYAFF